jgi:nitrate/TMAO reductase-like tetraheme cytochrome c subunit
MSDKEEKKEVKATEAPVKPAKKTNWLKISIIANIVLVVVIAVGAASWAMMRASDTDPKFCASCHIMKPMVDSYLSDKSTSLDHLHEKATIQCKQCHDYPLSKEIASGINFITGNYTMPLSYNKIATKEFCLKCHGSYDKLAKLTANYDPDSGRNPHESHNGELDCYNCHKSHGQSTLYCSQCHSDMKIPDGWEGATAQ